MNFLAVASLLFILARTVDVLSPIQVVRTAKYTGDRLTELDPIPWKVLPTVAENVPTLVIDPSTEYQEILGFGGAITEASSLVIRQMRPELQQEILEAYYTGHPVGNAYSVARLHINSCDFSLGNWSCDDTPFDWKLQDFNLTWHDTEVIIPLVQEVLARQPDLKIFASAWSPPWWFKKNDNMDGTEVPNGLKDSTPDLPYMSTWADFYIRWISEYGLHGIKIWAVTTQNEPTNVPRLGWEACAFSPAELRDFSRILATKLASAHPDVKVILHDDQKDTLPRYVPVLLSDPIVEHLSEFIGFHWYAGPFFENLLSLHEKYPTKKLFPTEACFTHFVAHDLETRWKRGEGYGRDILGDLNSFSVGWTDWNIVLNQDGGPNHVGNQCDAPIIANVVNQTLTYQITYYYLGHFSRFLPPGSVRVGSRWKATQDSSSSSSSSSSLLATTWRGAAKGAGTGTFVTVIMNDQEKASRMSLEFSGHVASFEVAPRSVMTLRWSV